AAPAASEEPSALAQFFRTPEGATGQNYRLAREAAGAGEIPSFQPARQAHLRELGWTEEQIAADTAKREGAAIPPPETVTPPAQAAPERQAAGLPAEQATPAPPVGTAPPSPTGAPTTLSKREQIEQAYEKIWGKP